MYFIKLSIENGYSQAKRIKKNIRVFAVARTPYSDLNFDEKEANPPILYV